MHRDVGKEMTIGDSQHRGSIAPFLFRFVIANQVEIYIQTSQHLCHVELLLGGQ